MTVRKISATPRLVAKYALLFVALEAAASANTVTIATGTNTTLGTAQTVSLAPDLVLNQFPPNYSLGTAQPVSPLYYGSDVLGSIASASAQEFFSVNLAVGENLAMQVNSTTPASQLTELLLYDANGNLVAIAEGNGSDGVSSVIDFTVPSGDAGNWTAEVVSPTSSFFNYNLRFNSPLNYVTDVFGALTDPAVSDYYSVSANVGDNLHFVVNSTSPASQSTELLLYDANGNLVAIAEGNGSNGLSSIIDFTVPSGDAGAWTAEVSDPSTSLYKYDLGIQGASGTGPVNPLTPIATPEPSFYALLGVSLGALALVRRRQIARRRI